MSKERRTVSLEPEVDEYLSRSGTNASELVNDLVKQHMNGGASEDRIREFRKQQLKSEYEQLVNQAKLKVEELNELREREQNESDEKRDRREEIWQNALESLEFEEMNSLGTIITSPESTVKKFADKLDMDVQRFKQEVFNRYDG